MDNGFSRNENNHSVGLFTLIAVVALTALTSAGLTYAYQNKQETELRQEIEDLKSQPAPSASPEVAAWKNYSNAKLGFSLVFTDAWEGFTAQENKDGSIAFLVPLESAAAGSDSSAQIFSISKVAVSTYDANKAAGMPVGTELLREGNFVFVRDKRLDAYPSNLKNKISESDIKAVLDTFKAL